MPRPQAWPGAQVSCRVVDEDHGMWVPMDTAVNANCRSPARSGLLTRRLPPGAATGSGADPTAVGPSRPPPFRPDRRVRRSGIPAVLPQCRCAAPDGAARDPLVEELGHAADAVPHISASLPSALITACGHRRAPAAGWQARRAAHAEVAVAQRTHHSRISRSRHFRRWLSWAQVDDEEIVPQPSALTKGIDDIRLVYGCAGAGATVPLRQRGRLSWPAPASGQAQPSRLRLDCGGRSPLLSRDDGLRCAHLLDWGWFFGGRGGFTGGGSEFDRRLSGAALDCGLDGCRGGPSVS